MVSNSLIDLHSHLLPNVDDGSKSEADSIKLARLAVDNGVSVALVTPHHMNGMYVNHKQDVIELTRSFQDLLNRENIPLKVFPSQEVRINSNLLAALDDDDILFADNDSRYLLLEFPDDDVPIYSSNLIFQIMQRGIDVQIAHPERNTKIMAEPEILFDLIQRGAVAQVTAGSYVGNFGKKVQKFADQIIESNLAHVFVSDAHALPNREYELREAMERLEKRMGKDYRNLFQENSESIINGDDLIKLEPQRIKKHRFFGNL